MIGRMGFRAEYRADWLRRLVDVMLHVTAAIILPAPFWAQWLPDVALVVMWPWSMVMDRKVAPRAPILLLHRFLHSPEFGLIFGVVMAFYVPTVGVHWGIHVIIDVLTHDNPAVTK